MAGILVRAGLASRANVAGPTSKPVHGTLRGQQARPGLQIMSCQLGDLCATLDGMFIAFTNTKGGVGKSTLSCHLAIWLFDRGYRVAVLDTDPQGTSSEWMSRAEPKITVRATSDSDEIRAARNELLEVHEFVIADTPGEEGEAANAVTLLADLVILPLQPTRPDVRALKDALKTIRLAHAVTQGQRPETVLVLNGVRKKSLRTAVLRNQLCSLGMRVAGCEIRRLDALADSCDSAVTRENTPKSKEAAADIDALFSELLAERLTGRSVANE